MTVRSGGSGHLRGAQRLSRDGAAAAATGPRGDMNNGREGSAAESSAWSGTPAAPVFQRVMTPQGTAAAPMATLMSPWPATSTTEVSMTVPVSSPPSAGPIQPLGDETHQSSRAFTDDRGGGGGGSGGGRGKGCSPLPQHDTTRKTFERGGVPTKRTAAAATAATAAPHVSAAAPVAMALAAMEEDEEDENDRASGLAVPMAAAASISATNRQAGGEMFSITANPPSTTPTASHGSNSPALKTCGDAMEEEDATKSRWPPPASAQMFPSAKAAAPLIAAKSASRRPAAPWGLRGTSSRGRARQAGRRQRRHWRYRRR
ncbi:unnamed protein product [Scytosiphon promiscuus]